MPCLPGLGDSKLGQLLYISEHHVVHVSLGYSMALSEISHDRAVLSLVRMVLNDRKSDRSHVRVPSSASG